MNLAPNIRRTTLFVRSALSVAALVATSVAGVVIGVPTASAAAATVANGITTVDLSDPLLAPLDLAQALVGTGVTVSQVQFSGADAQAGTIHVVDPAVVSFNDGIILSSGNIADVMGPNKSDGITGDMAGPHDVDLDQLIANTKTVNPVTYDRAVLEFDFVPTASPIYFTYVFGSDEYLEWVNLFNDVFAFYVNGQNCATVPTGEPISIDTINDTVNPSLFRDNSFSNPPAQPINIESDGLSVEMICTSAVNVGVTNHMKLAIADTSDQILDSVVMLKAGSLGITPPESCNDSVDNDDDTLVDMADSSCTSTTVSPPTGSSGIGSSGSAPAFTGQEGTPIVLDASVFGWTASPDALTATWTVTGINGTVADCVISPSTPQDIGIDGSIPTATALCPIEGEYVAAVEGWDVEAKSAFDDNVDFFVHNAPPAASISTPSVGDSAEVGSTVAFAATVDDPGADSITCDIDWGDGTTDSGVVLAGECTGEHTYSEIGTNLVSATVTDSAGLTAAAATIIDIVTPAVGNTAPQVTIGTAEDGAEGSALGVSATASDIDGDPLTVSWVASPSTGVDDGASCVFTDPAAETTSVTCTDDGTWHLEVSADDGTTSTTDSIDIVVSNAAPSVSITAPANGAVRRVGQSVAVSAQVDDAGENDPLVCRVIWGDGITTVGTLVDTTCSSVHHYATPGTRSVTVRASDGDAGITLRSLTIKVPHPPVVGAVDAATVSVGDAITVTGTGFTGTTAVTIGGVPSSTVTIIDSTTLVVGVPAGATSGRVAVTTPGGTARSAPIVVSGRTSPTISTVKVATTGVTRRVRLSGADLGATTSLRIDGTLVEFRVVSATVVEVVLPVGTSVHSVRVATAGGVARWSAPDAAGI